MITTWKCHMCGEERPDDKISVLSYPIKDLPGAVANQRYCNDKDECYQAAKEKAKTGKL